MLNLWINWVPSCTPCVQASTIKFYIYCDSFFDKSMCYAANLVFPLGKSPRKIMFVYVLSYIEAARVSTPLDEWMMVLSRQRTVYLEVIFVYERFHFRSTLPQPWLHFWFGWNVSYFLVWHWPNASYLPSIQQTKAIYGTLQVYLMLLRCWHGPASSLPKTQNFIGCLTLGACIRSV